MDKTPIFDIKPYVVYADSHPGARSGFVDDRKWQKLDVEISEDVDRHLRLQGLNAEKIEILKEVFAQDPRPHYQKILIRFMECPTRVWIFTSGFPIKP